MSGVYLGTLIHSSLSDPRYQSFLFAVVEPVVLHVSFFVMLWVSFKTSLNCVEVYQIQLLSLLFPVILQLFFHVWF